MEEIKPYSDKTSLLVDLNLYLAFKKGLALTLADLPRIATFRWPWMVENWDRFLYRQFFDVASVDQYLSEVLDVLQQHVVGWREGSKVNPFQEAAIFADSIELLQLVTFESISPTSSESLYAANELQRVSSFTESHFREMLKFLRTNRDTAFDYIGLPDDTYDSYRSRSRSAKQRDFFVPDLYNLEQTIQVEKFVEGLIFDLRFGRDLEPDLIEYANQNLLAGNSEVVATNVYSSFFQVPFEQSLEQMARDYLGSENQWFELVTVNKLKAPYVDLYGKKLFLPENASGNVVKVSTSDIEKYQIGATVKIGSRLVPDEVRKVENVIDNNDGSAIVTLSGKQDLSKLLVVEGAYLRVYAPDTIRDFSFVKIPVSTVSSYKNMPEPTLKVLKDLDKALYSFGVDLARDDKTGDLQIGPNGDLAITFGIPAIRGSVLNLVRTEQGELPLHREYGIPPVVGFAMEGGDSAVRVASIIETAISRDPRFTSVNITDIVISASGEISISASVGVAGAEQIIPLAFVV